MVHDRSLPSAEPRELRHGQYADSGNLAKRSSIYAYRRPELDLPGWVLGFADLQPRDRVVDVGCGPGSYLSQLADHPGLIVGADLSLGMASEASRFAPAVVSEAAALPFVDGSFDVALATHMLYHVEPPSRAISELRRVLRTGGVLLAVTNGEGHLDGFDRVIRTALDLDCWSRSMERFSLENGATQLREAFSQVDRHDVAGELIVPEVDPVMDYVLSIETFLAPQLQLPWTEALDRIQREVEREIERTGAFRSTVRSGVFVCR